MFILFFFLGGGGEVVSRVAGVEMSCAGGRRGKCNVLILLFTCGGTVPAFLLAKTLVLENVLDAAGCTVAIIGPVVVVLLVTASLQTLLTAGRVKVCERGILKTFARDASTGERGFMVRYALNWNLES